ncbi:MAG: thiamine-phosphate kinase [Ignavibacteria bacterium]|nr:thiamine-phosphate kinase [Ignavibacteria bacterium]MBI3766177.1 thiamine-phosphate kinase [Ignavibacteriales bacterium]
MVSIQQKRTEISSIGEFGLIDRIHSLANFSVDDFSLHDNLVKGISDDAAVFRPTPGKLQLITTDGFVEGIHFDLTFTSMKHLGWKAMVANFSDLAAMGAIPRYATLTISLPKKISVEMVEELYSGAGLACKKYSCLLVGGDTTTSIGTMMLSVAVTGEADERHVRYRDGAHPGEYLCVTGHLGASVAGLKILQREKERFTDAQNAFTFQPNLEPYAAAIEKHLMPKPRLDLSKILTEQVKIGALIDISDGLASEVHHLCVSSNAGAAVYEHSIPVDSMTQKIAAEFSEPPTDYALYGGEDYELLFTVSDQEHEKLDRLTNDVTIIGRMFQRENGIELVRESGEHEALRFGGWDHFKPLEKS